MLVRGGEIFKDFRTEVAVADRVESGGLGLVERAGAEALAEFGAGVEGVGVDGETHERASVRSGMPR